MEMKSNELRVGNKIDYFGEIHTLQTVGLWLHTDLSLDEIPLDQCKPIPLTEEWLVRFGFEKGVDFWHIEYYFIIDIIPDAFEFRYKPYTKINYVHQLQNLYFALTGEELELSPK